MDFAHVMKNEKLPRIVVDKDGIILNITPLFTTEFGWHSEDLVNKPLNTIVPERMRDAHIHGFSHYLTTLQPRILEQHMEMPILTKEGDELLARHYITSGEYEGERVFAAYIEKV